MGNVPELLIAFLGSALLTFLDLDRTFYIPTKASDRTKLYAWWWGFILGNGGVAGTLYLVVRDTGGLSGLHPWLLAGIVGISFPAIIRTKFTTITVQGKEVPLGLEAFYEAVKTSVYKRINSIAMRARYTETMAMASSLTLLELVFRTRLSISQNVLLSPEEKRGALGWLLGVLEDEQTGTFKSARFWQIISCRDSGSIPSRMLKKAKIRLLTRAAHCRECVFAGVYRAETVRESVPNDFFSSLLGSSLQSEIHRRATVL